MARSATPYGLRYTGHCLPRAHAQQNGSALIPSGGKLGVTSRDTCWPSYPANRVNQISSALEIPRDFVRLDYALAQNWKQIFSNAASGSIYRRTLRNLIFPDPIKNHLAFLIAQQSGLVFLFGSIAHLLEFSL